jgi:hypothetical protein
MREAVRRPGDQSNVIPIAAVKRFRRYKGETEKKIRQQQDVVRDKFMDKMLELMDWYLSDSSSFGLIGDENVVAGGHYLKICKMLHERGLICSPAEAEKVCIALTDYSDAPEFRIRAGLFLSAMVNGGWKERYILPVDHLEPLHYLGFGNVSDITILGDVGVMCGFGMREGWMTIKGSANRWLGHGMGGGLIKVEGDVGGGLGFGMSGGVIAVDGDVKSMEGPYRTVPMDWGKTRAESGGTIIVNGNVDRIGFSMEGRLGIPWFGGDIYVGGDIGSIEEPHGRIFHKGKLIVDK